MTDNTALVARAITAYRTLEAARKAETDAYQEKVGAIDDKMTRIRHLLLQHMNANEVSSMRTSAGRVETYLHTSARMDPDCWQDLFAYISEHNRFDLLQKRIGSKACRELLESGHAIPGVSLHAERKLRILKP